MCVGVFVCCHPIYSGPQTCGRTSRGHTGGRSHSISQPSSCVACLNFHREKGSAVPFPRRPCSRILCTRELIVLPLLLGMIYLSIYFCEQTSPFVGLHRDGNSRPNVRRFRGYQLHYRGDQTCNFSSTIGAVTIN